MSRVATFAELLGYSRSVDSARVMAEASSSRVGKNVFLAHSSRDAEYLPGVISILESNGGLVYVDKDDKRLPDSPNRETAEILRSTIQSCRRFVVFVTTNSKNSRWVPWELGLADGEKGFGGIALFPASHSERDYEWSEVEYLGLYKRIVRGRIRGSMQEGWIVLDHQANTALTLGDWIRGD